MRKPRKNEHFAMSLNGSPMSVAPARTGRRKPMEMDQVEIVGRFRYLSFVLAEYLFL